MPTRNRKRKRNITEQIALNLIAGILITVITVLAAIFWMAEKQNEQADSATRTMVIGGVQSMERRIRGIANDYAWWEDAYDAYLRADDEWMYSNIGSSVQDTNLTDMMAVLSPEGTVDYGWTQEDANVGEIITPPVIAGMRNLIKDVEVANLVAKSAYIRAGDRVMLIAVSRITPVSRADSVEASTLPVFVVGIFLSSDLLKELGKSFLIDDLRIETFDADGQRLEPNFPEISGLSGDIIGQFIWTPPAPGHAVLSNVILPILVALTIFCIVSLVAAYRARSMALALTRSEKEAVIAARTDGLTGLMNRTGFVELIDSDDYARFAKDGELAVIYIDINGFKAVNDSIGHHGGDDLVVALARRIKSVLPQNAVFSRIGGDEFAAVLAGPAAASAAATAAADVIHSLDRPFTVSGFEFHMTVAVGYAVATAGVDPNEVVRRADLAMYQAKAGAEREAVIYHSTMETGALEKKRVETAMRRGIERDEIRVVYQPVVRVNDLTLVGVEALVRWTSEELGDVSPSIFIPIAEETGLIHEIGRIVFRRACRDLARWPHLKMAINISPTQLREPSFTDELIGIVQQCDVSPGQFELELTEGILVSNPTIAKRKMAILKDLGFALSLDDFGTGFSSIGYLRQFPFDVLKVDRSFVRDIGLNSTANALIQSLVSLGEAMNLAVIAEGVENVEQLKLVRLVQCEYAQGHLISRALAADGIDDLLKELGTQRRFDLEIELPADDKMAAEG